MEVKIHHKWDRSAFLKEVDIAFKKHIEDLLQAGSICLKCKMSTCRHPDRLQETFAGFAVTLRGRIQGLRKAEVTFWKRDMRDVG